MTVAHANEGDRHHENAPWFNKRSVLVVEENPDLRRAIKLSLETLGMEVHEAATGSQAMSALAQNVPEFLIVEFDYPEGRNTDLIEHYRERDSSGRGSVIVTTTRRLEVGLRNQIEPIEVLFKPFDIRMLFKMLRRHLP